MDNLSRIFTRAIVDKHHVTAMLDSEVKSIIWKLLGALKAKENNIKFHQEFEEALKSCRY